VNDNDCDETGIYAYMHCIKCLDEIPDGVDPASYSDIAVGISPRGDLIVWCNRHSVAVARFKNSEVSKELLLASNTPCKCGNHPKETVH
jgi:hypothetical protein